MNDKLIWVFSPAIFSMIGLIAGYLNDPGYTLISAVGGCVAGFVIAAVALAGEESSP